MIVSAPRSRRLQRDKGRPSVTVCVAAIAEKCTVMGASDRMLTAGDVEFEPEQSKIWMLSSSIAVLLAGDAAIQAEIMGKVAIEVNAWILSDPEKWVSVKDAALLYCRTYRELLRQRAESEILNPLGLDFSSFLIRQAKMEPGLVSKLAEDLTKYDLPNPSETIFAGIDNDGPMFKGEKHNFPHIYVTSGSKLACLDSVGFAAIGLGRFHAESQLMFSGHWPSKPFHETLLLTYAAKKRAEVAPGVGKDTDMFVIGPALASFIKVEDAHLKGLHRIYDRSRKTTDAAIRRAQRETQPYVEQIRDEYSERASKTDENVSKQSTSQTSTDQQ